MNAIYSITLLQIVCLIAFSNAIGIGIATILYDTNESKSRHLFRLAVYSILLISTLVNVLG